MSTVVSFAEQFKSAICRGIELAEDSPDRYTIDVPFMFDDGDHYVIIAERDGEDWALTDEGHTLMHLSYAMPKFNSKRPKEIIDRVLRMHRVENERGELRKLFKPEHAADALFGFAQAITQVMDTAFLAQRARVAQRARATAALELVADSALPSFRTDFRSIVASAGRRWHVDSNYVHPRHDPTGLYPVDARVNGVERAQVLIFAFSNDTECQLATITQNRWREWGEQFRSVGIFPHPDVVSRDVLTRFTDVGDERPPYTYGLEDAYRYLPEVLESVLAV